MSLPNLRSRFPMENTPEDEDPIYSIPIVETWLVAEPTLMRPPFVDRPTLFIPPGEKGREALFQLRTQAVAWTFKDAMDEPS